MILKKRQRFYFILIISRISSMQLDEANEDLFMSLDVTPLFGEFPHATNTFFSAMMPRMNQQQLRGSNTRPYNLRRNSDFPCSSTHASRSSEFLQVPMSSSQQRLSNHSQQSSAKLPRARDIRGSTHRSNCISCY